MAVKEKKWRFDFAVYNYLRYAVAQLDRGAEGSSLAFLCSGPRRRGGGSLPAGQQGRASDEDHVLEELTPALVVTRCVDAVVPLAYLGSLAEHTRRVKREGASRSYDGRRE